MSSYHELITVAEAQSLVHQHCRPLSVEQVPLANALYRVVAEDIRAPIDLPPFAQSSVDGYAIAHSSGSALRFQLVGESSSGAPYEHPIEKQQAVRIMTGARVPTGCTAIVMQERCQTLDTEIVIDSEELLDNQHYRPRGSVLTAQSVAISSGSVLRAAGLNLLSSLGIVSVPVYRSPRIHLILSGNELCAAGAELGDAMIYESNSVSLIAALKAENLSIDVIHQCKDDFQEIQKAFVEASEKADVVIFCGGVSVGKYDFIPTVLNSVHAETIFYKVRQRPGKPLLYARHNDTQVFALPGNPASVLCCYYEYVLPALRSLMGFRVTLLPRLQLRLASPFRKNTSLQHFVRACTDFREVWPLEGQESYKMKSFADANCLLIVPAECTELHAGAHCDVDLFSLHQNAIHHA